MTPVACYDVYEAVCGDTERRTADESVAANGETMTDIMGSDDMDSSGGTMQNFVGRVESANENAVEEQFQTEYESDLDRIAIEPLEGYDSTQNVLGLNVSGQLASKWSVFVGAVENIHGKLSDNGIQTVADLCDFMEGRAYEWEELSFESDDEFTWEHRGDDGETRVLSEMFDSDYTPDPMLVPVREITGEELREYGEEPEVPDEQVTLED